MAAITLKELLHIFDIHPVIIDKPTSDDHLCAIALFLHKWRTVAPYLGLSENDLDAIEQEEKDEQVKRLKALQRWKGKFGFKATYKMLLNVLLSLAMADVAENVCLLLKGNVMHSSCCVCIHVQMPM